MRRTQVVALCLLALVPIAELSAHARIASQVVPDTDFAQAAAFVRSQLQERDLITVAPAWADPLLRLHLGDRIPLAMAGRSDDVRYERKWVLSIHGARAQGMAQGTPAPKPELSRVFGGVRVERYALGKSPVLYDFVQALDTAQVRRVVRGVEQPCPVSRAGKPRGGGLGRGVLFPLSERFQCDAGGRPWLFVGRVVLEDLSITPRHCIWQHPQGTEPIIASFHDVPLGEQLVFYGGLYYEHERMRQRGPVQAEIRIDGQLRATMVHRDGDGFSRLQVDTGSADSAGSAGTTRNARGTVSVAVSARDPHQRTFCWAATTRSAPDARAGAR